MGYQRGLDVASCFSLHECLDGVTLSRALPSTAVVAEVLAKFPLGDVARLVYKVKLFMNNMHTSKDPRIVYMLYIEVRKLLACSQPRARASRCGEREAVPPSHPCVFCWRHRLGPELLCRAFTT